jgi:hypothetical protein
MDNIETLCLKGGKTEESVRGCIMWRYQVLQVPDLRIIKGKQRAKSVSVILMFVVVLRGCGGGLSSVMVVCGLGDVSSQQ